MGGDTSSGGGSTVTQTTAIPDWQQGMVQANENIAQGIASQPYQQYQGQLIAPLTDMQNQGIAQTQAAAGSAQPDLQTAEGLAGQAGNSQWNAQTAQQYMSPYAMAAMQPQIQALQNNQALQSQQLNAGATQAGAFGDARQGVQQSLDNFNNNQSLNDLVSSGMNTAYTTGQNAFNAQNQNLLNASSQYGNLGQAQQSTGLAGANAVFNAGTQQQSLNQQQLTEAYQNFMNQVNYPAQMLNLRIASTANSPYTVPTANLAPTSSSAQNLGAFASLAGGLGSLLGGSSGSSSGSVYGSSDRRLKKWVHKVGEVRHGINLYRFSYIWEDKVRMGVMADEVKKIMPEAVVQDAAGFDMVNYPMVFGHV